MPVLPVPLWNLLHLSNSNSFIAALAGCRYMYFSLQVDASTDASLTEDELFFILYLDPHCSHGKGAYERFLSHCEAAE